MTYSTELFTIDNVSSGETVHQRCVLLKGHINHTLHGPSLNDHVTITTTSPHGLPLFPSQTWPVAASGHFKVLLMLTPGSNMITLKLPSEVVASAADAVSELPPSSSSLIVTYVPLLQVPPLRLAVLVAKDSPLLIDCPLHKGAGITSAHSDLSAVVAKLRMTAYMWQALTAEDMRAKGLGRRSFRLEEEWALDTVSKSFAQVALESASGGDISTMHMQTTAKVHVVRSDRTVAELRDPGIAQQNAAAREKEKDKLYEHFHAALRDYGGEAFAPAAHATVAGLILDSHYSVQQGLILAHAALGGGPGTGGSNKTIALGMFGSHTTWAWPRFIEEVPSCLLDTHPSGHLVGNDNGECGTGWQACAVGQGAFLHEVGHAFGRPHTTGIMARGYAHDWPKNFLPFTAPGVLSSGMLAAVDPVIEGKTRNEAVWDLTDALHFTFLPHFRLPDDPPRTPAALRESPAVEVRHNFDEAKAGLDNLRLAISSVAGIARISFNGVDEPEPSIAAPATRAIEYTYEDLARRFRTDEGVAALELRVLGMNGKEKIVSDVWAMFTRLSFVRIPGSQIVLRKRSIKSKSLEQNEHNAEYKYWEWTALLKERGADGRRESMFILNTARTDDGSSRQCTVLPLSTCASVPSWTAGCCTTRTATRLILAPGGRAKDATTPLAAMHLRRLPCQRA